MVKNLPANAGDTRDVGWIPGWEDPLEKDMATHSSSLAWRIPWTEEPGSFLLPWPGNQGESKQQHVTQDPRVSETLVPVRDDSAQASEPQGAAPRPGFCVLCALCGPAWLSLFVPSEEILSPRSPRVSWLPPQLVSRW